MTNKSKDRSNFWIYYAAIFVLVLIYYSPIIINPDIFIKRGNDLEEFFWPILSYVKNHFLADHSIPLWNNLFLAGTPLLPDPQSPIFYPFNIFSLFLPLKNFYIIALIFHSIIAGLGFFWCSKIVFKYSDKINLILAILYITTPKLGSYLEAGHVGLIYAYSWIPLIMTSMYLGATKPNFKSSIVLSASLALLYYSHLPTFIVTTIFLAILLIANILVKNISLSKPKIGFFILAAILTIGFTGVSLFPQIESQKASTRYLLLKNPDTYPKWNSILEPLKVSIAPWAGGIHHIDTEKWIPTGIFILILTLIGFFKLENKYKVFTIIGFLILILISLNNASPIYPFLLKQKWFLLLRVSTRFWICMQIIIFYLVGKALTTINSYKKRKVFYLLTILAISESILLTWMYLYKPISKNIWLAPESVYEYINKDKTIFRVFCLTRCLSQKKSSDYGFELLDGYSTLQLKNFNQQSWQLTGSYWDYYTLSIPPIGTYTLEKLKPDTVSLAEYNVKYIISPYKLNDSNLSLNAKIQGFYIYLNKSFLPRSYFYNSTKKTNTGIPLDYYSPNKIRLNILGIPSGQIRVSNVYSEGWKAYVDGVQTQIMETPNALMAININGNSKYVDFIYSPNSFYWGKIAAIFSAILITIFFVKNYFKIR